MAIKRSNRRVAAARIAASARQLLDASTLCTIATVTSGGRAHINTAYFAWSHDFEIVWLSGWAPHASQQKPLAPGSARMRLADALNAREERLPRD